MPAHDPVVRKHVSKRMLAGRYGDEAAIQEASRDLAAVRIEAKVREIVAAAPPLTPEQRDRIVALLQGGVGNA